MQHRGTQGGNRSCGLCPFDGQKRHRRMTETACRIFAGVMKMGNG